MCILEEELPKRLYQNNQLVPSRKFQPTAMDQAQAEQDGSLRKLNLLNMQSV